MKALIAYNGYNTGLGNRIRVVLGALSLAELENRRFAYVWPRGTLFESRFSDLWDFREGTVVSRAVSRVLARRWPYVDHTLTWLDDDARRRRLWQIQTGSPIGLPPEAAPWTERFRALRPVPEIADRVTALFDRELRGRPYIGVMIRAHTKAHARTLEQSPVEWYAKRMTEIRADHPDVPFYVSCDVPEVQDAVCDEVGNCVAQRDKGSFNSAAALRSSVVDLYLLGCAGYLVGPHFSSFVHLAENLAEDRIALETSVTGPGDVAGFTRLGLAVDPLRPAVRRLA